MSIYVEVPRHPSWKEALLQSSKDFVKTVWPVVRDWCGGGEIVAVEEHSLKFARIFDLYAGFDALQITPEGIRGIASRIQYGKCYATFTLRTAHNNTYAPQKEFEKRFHAWYFSDEGWLLPYFTIQAYFSAPGGTLLGVGAIKTKDLIEYIVRHSPHQVRTNSHDGNEFLVASWDDIVANGYEMFIYKTEDPQHCSGIKTHPIH